MILGTARQLVKVKVLHSDRAENTLRERKAALDSALAATDAARATLHAWRDDLPRKETALYDPVIGKPVRLLDLDELKAKLIALREHERLLEQRLAAASASASDAREVHDDAYTAAQHARRDVSKYEDFVETLRVREVMETERLAERELDDFTNASGGAGADRDRAGDDVWHHATT